MTADEYGADLSAFLNEYLARNATTSAPTVDQGRAFQRGLFEAGLAGPSWPAQYGGAGLPSETQRVFDTVTAAYPVPVADLTLSLRVCGPAVMEFGDEEQKARHLAATLRGDHVWCQLWSEPEAGSDLAGVRTSAAPTPDGGWLVRGQKVWTSGAHYADFGLLLCRTDPSAAKHSGLSMLIVDMRLPGVTVRPLRQMTGEEHFNEVFLDDVRLPAGSLLGRAGQGWQITTWMMSRERVSVGLGMRTANTLSWADVREVAERSGRASEPAVRHRLAELHIRQRAAELLGARLSQEMERGVGNPLLGSAAKVVEAAVIRESAELAVELLGNRATAWSTGERDGTVAGAVLMCPGFAIGGGTDDIQLNTLGEHVLGLPREPRPDDPGRRSTTGRGAGQS